MFCTDILYFKKKLGDLNFFSKTTKWGDPNKLGGWNFFQNLIKGEVLIRAGRVDFFQKINKRASPFIRHLRYFIIFVSKTFEVGKLQ